MDNKVIIVTGGNRGLGAATARQLAAKGHHVIITARSTTPGNHARLPSSSRGSVAMRSPSSLGRCSAAL